MEASFRDLRTFFGPCKRISKEEEESLIYQAGENIGELMLFADYNYEQLRLLTHPADSSYCSWRFQKNQRPRSMYIERDEGESETAVTVSSPRGSGLWRV